MDPTSFTPPRGVNPGPIDKSVLWAGDHRCERVWLNQMLGSFKLRDQAIVKYDDRYQDALESIGFASIKPISKIHLDAALITAVVESWRPETSTFHFRTGECTITLQDVEMILGLRVEGLPVTTKTDKSQANSVQKMCEVCLGVNPGGSNLEGTRLNMKWLRHAFDSLPEDAGKADVDRYALAYMLSLIGGVLFPNRSGANVTCNYLWILRNWDLACRCSWGSAVLSNTYHEMGRTVLGYGSTGGNTCGDLAGCYILIQLWAWQRLPSIAPIPVLPYSPASPFGLRWTNPKKAAPKMHVRDHRRFLDTTDDFVWNPYMLEEHQFRTIWVCVTPLICFHSVAWHHPDRVMRQFNLLQHIPTMVETKNEVETLLKKDNRAQENDWPEHHSLYVQYWEESEEHRICGDPIPRHSMHYHAAYMEWYRHITRRFITYDAGQLETMNDILEHARQFTRSGDPLNAATVQSLDQLLKNCMLVGDGDVRELRGILLDEAPHRQGYLVYPDYVPPAQQERRQQKRRACGRANEEHEQQLQIPEPLQVSSSGHGSSRGNCERTQPYAHHATSIPEYHGGFGSQSQHVTPSPTSQLCSLPGGGHGGSGFSQVVSTHSQETGGFSSRIVRHRSQEPVLGRPSNVDSVNEVSTGTPDQPLLGGGHGGSEFSQFGSTHFQGTGGFSSLTVQHRSQEAVLGRPSNVDSGNEDWTGTPDQPLLGGHGRGKAVINEGGSQRDFRLRPLTNLPSILRRRTR